jgi:hypothetical protein
MSVTPWGSVVNWHRFVANPDPAVTFHFDADPDSDPTLSFYIFEIWFKWIRIRIRQNEANLNPTTLPEDDIFRIKSGNKDMVPNYECFESGLDQNSIRSVDLNPDSETGSGSRRVKKTHKNRKNVRNFMF